MIGLSVDIVPVDPVALLVPHDADDSYPAIRPSEGLLSLGEGAMGSSLPTVDDDVGAGTLAEGFPALPLYPPMRRLRAGPGVFPWSAKNHGTPVCGVGQSPWTSVLSTDTDPP